MRAREPLFYKARARVCLQGASRRSNSPLARSRAALLFFEQNLAAASRISHLAELVGQSARAREQAAGRPAERRARAD